MKNSQLPIWAFCLPLLFTLLSLAQAPGSANPATRQLTSWLAAFDGANWNAYQAFVQKNFATQPEPMFQDPRFRQRTGGFDFKKIEAETPLGVTALIQERDSDLLVRIVVEVEQAEPHRIRTLHPQPIPRPPEMAIPRLGEKELIASLRDRIQHAVSADKFAGAVLVAKNGNPIFAQAYGLADREHHIPNTLQTRFRIGSMNKMFTAVATLQLVNLGKLRLDDPMGQIPDGLPQQGISFQSDHSPVAQPYWGTGDFFGPEFETHRLEWFSGLTLHAVCEPGPCG